MKNSERFYRDFSGTLRWKSFRVRVENTDLYIRADKDLSVEAEEIINRVRGEIFEHIGRQKDFLVSYTPVDVLDTESKAVKLMYTASVKSGTGPMAAVAGAVAEIVGTGLSEYSSEIIVENGGDIWLSLLEPVSASIFCGRSPFNGKLAIRVLPGMTPAGICTSSATIGHSFSFGKADAATVVSADAALADAVATETCNRVKCEDDIIAALDYATGIDGITGAVIVFRDKLAVQGDIEIVKP